MSRADDPRVATTNGLAAEIADGPAPAGIDPASGQHKAYWVLSDEERAKGFERPVRDTYKHVACGSTTSMGRSIAETYARQPSFYGSTFCVLCKAHLPVGTEGEFEWLDGSKVGS